MSENMADITGILKALNDATNTITGATTIKVLGGAVTILKEALMNLTNIVQEQSEEEKKNKREARHNADELDDYKQKSLKGKFVITVNKKRPSFMKKEEDLASGDEKALPNHIIDLAKTKYEVDIALGDIASCHYLPKGGIFFSLWNLRPDSVFQKLTKNIKDKAIFLKNKDKNVFFNFMLTKRRSTLLFEVRKLKKVGRIHRFYSDENGVISIKVKSNDSNKKLSSIQETATSSVKTFQVTELYELAPELPQ
jgi:hypothetical protein